MIYIHVYQSVYQFVYQLISQWYFFNSIYIIVNLHNNKYFVVSKTLRLVILE